MTELDMPSVAVADSTKELVEPPIVAVATPPVVCDPHSTLSIADTGEPSTWSMVQWQALTLFPCWAGSCVVHLILVLLLVLIHVTVAQTNKSAPVTLSVSANETVSEIANEEDQLQEFSAKTVQFASDTSELSKFSPNPEATSIEIPLAVELPVVELPSDQTSSDADLAAAALKSASQGVSGKSGTGSGVGKGRPYPYADAETSFFGSKSSGRRFVFVVDNSSSMDGAKFRRTLEELMLAVGKLNEQQDFYVIFFSDQAYPLFYPTPAKSLVPANSENKEKLLRWVQKVYLVGQTRGSAAMKLAFALEPDVIYLLSDGEFADNTVLETLGQKTTKIKVHTVGINLFPGSQQELAFQTIARQFYGTYRNVIVD
jgi:hypothetical protein